MSLKVYDYHTDIVNMLVTPQIRCRFLKMAVGQFNAGHTHDLGHEIFLILQGRAEFEIDGQSAVLGPGQMCIALTDQYHTVRNVGDDEVIMFLSVTPHIQPTHTYWNDDGSRTARRAACCTAGCWGHGHRSTRYPTGSARTASHGYWSWRTTSCCRARYRKSKPCGGRSTVNGTWLSVPARPATWNT